MNWIAKIRNKPDAVKIRIIWGVCIGVFALLVIVWGISYKYRKNIPKDTTLFKTIGEGVKKVKDNYDK